MIYTEDGGRALKKDKIKYPLTHPQQRVWYSEKRFPGTAMWSNAGTLKIKGRIDLELLKKAIRMYVRDNDSIRLRVGEEDGVAYQYVSDEMPGNIDTLDFSAEGEQALYAWDTLQSQTPLTLIDSNLCYFAVFRLGEQEGGMYAKIHHIISDALSMVTFSSKVLETYGLLLKDEEPDSVFSGSYIDFVNAEQEYLCSKRFERDRSFWLSRFGSLPEPTVLKQKPRKQGTRARRKTYVLSSELSQKVRDYCARFDVSVFAFFLSALSIYISRITNKKDLIISTPVYNRTSRSMRQAFGMFVSTVPVRINIDDELTFSGFAQKAANEWFSVLKHQKYPYDMLLQELRKTNKELDSLYDITLSYQNAKFERKSDLFSYEGRWHFTGYQATSLNIHIHDRDDSGKLLIDYDHLIPMYSLKEIEYIHMHLLAIFEAVFKHASQPLHSINILTSEERQRILSTFNDTGMEFPKQSTIADLWNEWVEKQPDAAAFVCAGKTLSYKEADELAAGAAAKLLKLGIGRDDAVGVMTYRNADVITGEMGAVKAGAAFVPLDPDLPDERIAYMLSDSGAKAVIVSDGLAERAAALSDVPIISAADILPVVDFKARMPEPGDIAYIIYTSGSTGRPKGVMIEHNTLTHYIFATAALHSYGPGARMLCASSISFDISIMEIYCPLALGGTVVMAMEHEVNIPKNMVSLISKEGVTIMVLTPGRMEMLLSDPGSDTCLRDMTDIISGGDVLLLSLLKRIQARTNARIYNYYGPTEITIAATCKDVTEASEVNIGRPLKNVKAYILDSHMNPVPIGVYGELYIGGLGLARGYINNPELTAERFVQNPFAKGEMLYRTGDMARWYPRGEIEFLGRMDQQVKIRGYRVELGEIEEKLQRISGVFACAVADRIDNSGQKYLGAYIVGETELTAADIKRELSKELPSYMVPSHVVFLDELPLNNSGKVDKRRLPDPMHKIGDAAAEIVAPKTTTEKELAQIWSEVLGAKNIGRDDSFFDIGGNSLSVITMLSQVRKKYGAEVSLEELYLDASLKNAASLIDAAVRGSYAPIEPAPKMRDYPVSSAQKRMYVMAMSDASSLAYNMPMAFEFKSRLPKGELEKAFKKLIESREAFRTVFEIRRGELRQRVMARAAFKLDIIEQDGRRIKSLLKSLVQPFDLGSAPLIRAGIIRGATGDVLFVDMHHIIGDMRTSEIILEELERTLGGRPGAAFEIEYKDYAVYENKRMASKEIAKQKGFWMSELSGELPLLNLKTDKPRGARMKYTGARCNFTIEPELSRQLKSIAAAAGATPFMFMLAAYNIFLKKYTGQHDIIIGAPVSGRNRYELKDVAGIFLNTLPLRNRPEANKSFSDFLEEVKDNCVVAYDNADYPLDMLVGDLNIQREVNRNPLYDTMLVFQTGTQRPVVLSGQKGRLLPFDPGVAKLDITLEVYDGDGMECLFEYNSSLFKRSTARRMASHMKELIKHLCENPGALIKDVGVMSGEELHMVTRGFNMTDAPLPDGSIQGALEELARRIPDKKALVVDDKSITFGQLNDRANQIALRLKEDGVSRNTVVALHISRSFDMMAALMGILKAGGGYLPLDPAYPDDRVAFMLKDSGATHIITDCDIDFEFDGAVIYTKDISTAGRVENPEHINEPQDAAYIIYTSGSTGTPKGVVLPRIALYNLYEATKSTIAFDPDEISVSVTTVSFDIFVIDAIMPMLFGCTVVICTEEELRQPVLLAGLIEREGVAFIQTTPTRMRLMMEDKAFRKAAGGNIKKIVLGGEEFPSSLLALLKKHTSARIISGYGPSETTVYCTFKDLSATRHITIGKPIINTRMYILDADMNPTPIGVPGEAYIGGHCVGTGYIGRNELNKKSFLPAPFFPGGVMYKSGDICAFMENGEMEIMGRADNQIKIRGLRIELGEIEAAMREFPGIDEAVVKDFGSGMNKYLCGYFASKQAVDKDELRKKLGERLPNYMVPQYLLQLEAMPLTLNGKVDRKALPEPDKKAQPEAAVKASGMSAAEKKMARIWSRVLGVSGIRPDDNFFSLGGDSLAVIKVQAAIIQFGWSIRTQDFYSLGTLRKICSRIDMKEEAKAAGGAKGTPALRVSVVPSDEPLMPVRLETVLLTGATGYAGAYILRQLRKEYGSKVYCIVRAEDNDAARKRLFDTVRYYFAMEAEGILAGTEVLKGDVSRHRIGLSRRDYEKAAVVDTVVHCAAITSHIGRPEDFDRVNVEGTRQAVRLAKQAGAVLLHLSTISVTGTHFEGDAQKHGELSERDYFIGQNYTDNEYVRTKFIAEGIVLEAIEKGLDARIYRIGNLTGRTGDGKFQREPEKNAFAQRIKALISIGAIPQSMEGQQLELAPVDASAEAVLALAAAKGMKERVYHLDNPNVVTAGWLAKTLSRMDRAIEVKPDAEFTEIVLSMSRSGKYDSLAGLLVDVSQGEQRIALSSDITSECLKGIVFKWPVIDEKYIEGYVSDIFAYDKEVSI